MEVREAAGWATQHTLVVTTTAPQWKPPALSQVNPDLWRKPRARLPTSHESQAGDSGGLSSLSNYLQEAMVRGEVNRPCMCSLEGALDYSL